MNFSSCKGALLTLVLTKCLVPYGHNRVREKAIISHFKALSIYLYRLIETTDLLSRFPMTGISGNIYHYTTYTPRREKGACVQMVATWNIYRFFLRDMTAPVQIT